MQVQKLASAIHNNILGGLSGYNTNFSISLEQLEDAVIEERLSLIKEYTLKGLINPIDLYTAINCIQIDCNTPIEKCRCGKIDDCSERVAHFEIPQLLNDLGDQSIFYLGSTDKQLPFIYYTSVTSMRNHKYRKRGKNKPVVWIDITPNENGMYDCFIFNAPLLDQISIMAAFKDPRQLEQYSCCNDLEDDNVSFLDAEIIDRVSKKMLAYYRQYYRINTPNNQTYTPG